MRRPVSGAVVAAILWVLVSGVLLAVAGAPGGMGWFLMNEPLSGWVAARGGVHSDPILYFAGVTIVNSLVLGILIEGVIRIVKHRPWSARRRGG